MKFLSRLQDYWKKTDIQPAPIVEDPLGDTYHSFIVFSGGTPIASGRIPKHHFHATRTGYRINSPLSAVVSQAGKATSISIYNRWGDESLKALIAKEASSPPYASGFHGEMVFDRVDFTVPGEVVIKNLDINHGR